MGRATLVVALAALALAGGCALFPSVDYLDRGETGAPDGGAASDGSLADASADAGADEGRDAGAVADGATPDALPPDALPSDALAPDAAPLHCFGGSTCAEGQVCCMRTDYSSGYCVGANGCLNDTFVCDENGYCAARGLGSVCCGTGDDAGTLTGSTCGSSCGGQLLCNPLSPGACPSPKSCVRAVAPVNYYVCQ